MPVRDVSATELIRRASEELKQVSAIKQPEWANYVKTGVSRERPPEQPNWWYTRAASLLRRIYIDSPMGISRLRTYYGGGQDRGSAPQHFKKGGGKILRTILQQLEQAGMVTKAEKKGRKLTPKGAEFLLKIAEQILQEKKGEKSG
jgi:small subunit ribosomal protein S19e